jgi:cellulose synthase operon protein C
MKPSDPLPSQLRAFASYFLNVANQAALPDWLKPRLPAVQKYLEDHEAKLPIRGIWLAAVRLAQLSNADVLGLARVRDRLLNRLLERGLSPEVDLPSFLRFSGLKNSERVRQVREKMAEIHLAARSWAEKSLKPSGNVTTQADSTCTLAYLDLMFAFGLAKLGEVTPAQALIESARKTLSGMKATETKGIVASFLLKVYQFRIENVLAGKPHAGLLSPALLEELDAIQKRGSNTANDPNKLAHYVINRMREQSDIIEPQEKNDPYAEWMKHGDELKRELAELPKLKDSAALGRRIRELFNGGTKGKVSSDTKFTVLHDALHLCPRVGQDFTVEMLRQVPSVLKTATATTGGPSDQAKKQGQLLERAMFLAAHFDNSELVQELGDQFIEYVHGKSDDQRYELVNIVAGRCLKSLRKVGLRDETDRLLQRMQNEILKGKSLAQLKVQYGTKPDTWADALQTMLNIAGGWLTFGLVPQATSILETAREEILSGGGKIGVPKFTKLCETYATTLGQGPPDLGMPKVVEMFRKLEPARITNTFTTAPYYSRLHLNIIEDVVLAMVSDDFALGQSGKRWLDEDEHLVRRRIHRDMRDLVKRTGV